MKNWRSQVARLFIRRTLRACVKRHLLMTSGAACTQNQRDISTNFLQKLLRRNKCLSSAVNLAQMTLATAACCLVFVAAHTQAQTTVRYSSGTGFFVSPDGHIITNAHVLSDCQSISIAGAATSPVEVIGIDRTHDLALLKTPQKSPRIAPLRFNIAHLRVGEPVAVVGYPGDSGFRGELVYRGADLMGFEGPVGEPHFLQFTPSAQKGNSGGPLLDKSGNVIGVVTGKTQLYAVDKTSGQPTSQLIREADVAVTLPYLSQFLAQYGVRTSQGGGGLINVTNRYIAQTASQFIVHIRCRL